MPGRQSLPDFQTNSHSYLVKTRCDDKRNRNTVFEGFNTQSLVLRSVVYSWILKYRNWPNNSRKVLSNSNVLGNDCSSTCLCRILPLCEGAEDTCGKKMDDDVDDDCPVDSTKQGAYYCHITEIQPLCRANLSNSLIIHEEKTNSPQWRRFVR